MNQIYVCGHCKSEMDWEKMKSHTCLTDQSPIDSEGCFVMFMGLKLWLNRNQIQLMIDRLLDLEYENRKNR